MPIVFNNTTPAAPTGGANVAWQFDGTNASAYVPAGTFSGATGAFGVTVNGGTSVPATGSQGYVQVPYAGTIASWSLLADQSGSAQVTIKKCTYAGFPATTSIVGGSPPALSSAQSNASSALTGWTTSFAAGDIMEFNLDSVATCVKLFLEVQVSRS